jgi:TolB protein
MAPWNRSESVAPRGRSRLLAAATGLALCLCALVLAPSAPATFPGKNGKIAFAYTTRGGLSNAHIHTMRRDGSHERRVARGRRPAFSPSGRKILFRARSRNRGPGLYTIRANGTHRRRIPNTGRGFQGSFAPGGKKIVFSRVARHRHENFDLYTIRTDGSHRRRITRLHGASRAQFSPNGRWIVFDFAGDICLIRPNGTHLRTLTDDSGGAVSDHSPDFSPNGRKVVFTRERHPIYGKAIYSIRLDGTRLKSVYEASSETIGDPVFSPDGRKIALSRRSYSWSYKRIYTIRPDGSHMRRLSHGPGGYHELSWGTRR